MLVLLDLDGTLTDPWDGITRSVAHALDRLGRPALDETALRSFIGPPLQDSFAGLGLDGTGVEAAVRLYRERFAQQGLYEIRVYDGVAEALADLCAQGHRLAVATSKPTVFAQRIVEHVGLDRHLDVTVGATLDGSRRAKADVIAVALHRLGRPDTDAVMVGDRQQDVDGARAHGLPCLGVAWGYADPGELEQAGAIALLDAPADLAPAVADLARQRS